MNRTATWILLLALQLNCNAWCFRADCKDHEPPQTTTGGSHCHKESKPAPGTDSCKDHVQILAQTVSKSPDVAPVVLSASLPQDAVTPPISFVSRSAFVRSQPPGEPLTLLATTVLRI